MVSFALDPFDVFSGRLVLVHLNRGNGDGLEDRRSVTTLMSGRFLVKQYRTTIYAGIAAQPRFLVVLVDRFSSA